MRLPGPKLGGQPAAALLQPADWNNLRFYNIKKKLVSKFYYLTQAFTVDETERIKSAAHAGCNLSNEMVHLQRYQEG